MTNLAKTVDPKKSINEKGKDMFKTDKEAGVKFMRILLEALSCWGQRFRKQQNQQPTRYFKILSELNDSKITLPEDFKYFKPLQRKTKK